MNRLMYLSSAFSRLLRIWNVGIHLIKNTQSQLRKGDYVHGMCLSVLSYMKLRSTVVRTCKLLTYNSLRHACTQGNVRKYISLRPACTQGPARNEYYVQGDSVAPLAYVYALRGMPKKMDAVQARGKVHTQFLFFISLMLLIGGCVHITSDRAIVQSKPPVVIDLTPTPEKTFTRCNPPACEDVDPADRMKGHACDSKPTSCI